MHTRVTLTAAACVSLLLALEVPAAGGPAAPGSAGSSPAALAGGGERSRGYSAAEAKEIADLAAEVQRFQAAADSYRSTLNGIVKREYEQRRRAMTGSFEKLIRKEEAEERVRRVAAITLFEDFLRRYPNDRRWTPDVIFRLAELYFEKANDEYLLATERYEQDLLAYERAQAASQKGHAARMSEAPAPPKQNYAATIELHRKLIREFPRYRLVDGAYYLLGFCLSETGELERGNQAYLALVCSNQFRPPLSETDPLPGASEPSPTVAAAARGGRRGGRMPLPAEPVWPRFDSTVYDGCQPLLPKSRFNGEAWVRIGEFHFDENQLGEAIASYRKVLDIGPENNAYYDEALYKLAWTYYRADKFVEAIKYFDKLVAYADAEYEKTGKHGSEMRPEAVQYLGISFAEEDWDGDTLPDSETGLERIEKFYAGRDKDKHVYEVYRRLADIYFDTTKYDESMKVYKLMLSRWPHRAENPEIQDRVILALERQRRFEDAIKEREEFTRLFGKGTDWERHNRNNPQALKKARDFDEQALIQAAVFHHKLGQDLKTRGLAMNDGNLLQQASNEYSLAATSYEKYLERFPDTKNSYEIRYSYASCLYYSQRFLEAGKIFAEVRDSNLDNRYQEEAAFMATKSYEEYIAAQVREGQMPDPPLPQADKPPSTLAAMTLPDAYQKWQEALDAYAKVLPSSPKSPRLVYKSAEISFRFLDFEDARKRFADIYEKFCKDPMSINAGQAILVTYQLENNLDRMEEWATRLKSGKCGGGSEVASKTASEAGKLVMGIRFTRAMELFKNKDWDRAAAAFLSLVDADPKGSDADKALNNAAVCYESSKRFESATKIYERIWQQYPSSEFADEALWRTALNYQRFFEFDKAVNNFLILSDSPRFASSSHRVDSIYNAAVILENDQAYARAAQLFLRYAREVGKPKEAAEAYFRAGEIYEKMNDQAQMVKLFRDFAKLYGGTAGMAEKAVEGLFRIGRSAQKRNDWATAQRYYRLTMTEFSARGLAPASEAAELAAQAAFELAEHKLRDFLKVSIRGAVNTLMAQEAKVAKHAKALNDEYERVWSYRRARWTLAAMYRSGTIFEHFARALDAGYRNAPVPPQVKRLGPDALDIYQQQLDEAMQARVDPVIDIAKKKYEACVSRAKEFGVSNKYTEEALIKLNAFDSAAYPLLKRAKVETVLE